MKTKTPKQKATALRQAYQLGRDAACDRQAAYETYNAFPPDRCPFKKGTPEEAEYDRGWKAQMTIFDKRGD